MHYYTFPQIYRLAATFIYLATSAECAGLINRPAAVKGKRLSASSAATSPGAAACRSSRDDGETFDDRCVQRHRSVISGEEKVRSDARRGTFAIGEQE